MYLNKKQAKCMALITAFVMMLSCLVFVPPNRKRPAVRNRRIRAWRITALRRRVRISVNAHRRYDRKRQ